MPYNTFLVRLGGISAAVLVCGMVTPVLASESLSNFYEFTGETETDYAGYQVTTAGDVNGDGFDDALISAYYNDDAALNAGAVYLYYGSDILPDAEASLSDLVEFTGESESDLAGYTVSSAGDVNGDGFDDLLVGVPYDDDAGSNAGAAYLIYGQAAELISQSLSAADAKFTGENTNDYAGYAVASGDVNGDGFSDLIIGAPYNDDTTSGYDAKYAGSTYVVYGPVAAGTTSLSAAVQLQGNLIYAGSSVASMDVNGDGFDDILVGSIGSTDLHTFSNRAYLVYGTAAELTSGYLYDHVVIMSYSATISTGGTSNSNFLVSSAGDVDGDGYEDMFILRGTSKDVYLIYGRAANFSAGTTGASEGTRVFFDDNDYTRVSSAGDVDADGMADMLFGIQEDDEAATDAGAAFLLFGAADTLDESDLATAEKYTGEVAGDNAAPVGSAGDLNGDGNADIIVGATKNDDGATDGGAAYIQYGLLDLDGDGVAGVIGGDDCDDEDAAVSSEQTFYADADGDGLGDPASSVTLCTATVPDGYVTNANDADDTAEDELLIEIDGDEVDNDGDGVIDEVNTVAENGYHPSYQNADVSDAGAYALNVTSVKGKSNGNIRVRYSDNSVYVFNIFDTTSDKVVGVKSFTNTGYLVVLSPGGTKAALVNVYTGGIYETEVLATQAFGKKALKQHDVRDDGVNEMIVILKTDAQVKVVLLKVNTNNQKLSILDKIKLKRKNVYPRKTTFTDQTIQLRNKTGTLLKTLNVSTAYELSQ
ncbi:MAG: integrin alpha [Patescibacteria group bacterium]